eukprot:scaffold408608_cov47-Attheya_sp.AAC.1
MDGFPGQFPHASLFDPHQFTSQFKYFWEQQPWACAWWTGNKRKKVVPKKKRIMDSTTTVENSIRTRVQSRTALDRFPFIPESVPQQSEFCWLSAATPPSAAAATQQNGSSP